MHGVLTRRWRGARQMRHMGSLNWRDWRPDHTRTELIQAAELSERAGPAHGAADVSGDAMGPPSAYPLRSTRSDDPASPGAHGVAVCDRAGRTGSFGFS